MLLAYLDEIGETGAFVARDDPKFNTSPAFGYAGFVVPELEARGFGREFAIEKRRLFATELASVEDPNQWERKGAQVFRPRTPDSHPQHLRVFSALVRALGRHGGALFYYADEKPIGLPKDTNLNVRKRESDAMRETLNRLCTYAESLDQNLMVMLDQIHESERAKRLPNMYGHILGRAADRQEMLRIVEPPMHVDSVLSSNIQFADWIAAAVTRSIDYHLIYDTKYSWVPDKIGVAMHGLFTNESKLHLWHRAVPDFNHSDIVKRYHPIHPKVAGQSIGSNNARVAAKIHEAAVAASLARKRQQE